MSEQLTTHVTLKTAHHKRTKEERREKRPTKNKLPLSIKVTIE